MCCDLYGFAWTGPDISRSVLVAVGVPQSIAVSPANRYLLLSLLTLFSVTALTLALAWAGSRLVILGPVKRMLDATRRIASGELAFRTRIVSRARSSVSSGGRSTRWRPVWSKQQQTLREQRGALP